MSTICPKFVQNAWKKDLCSNCFKSKEEHAKLASPKVKTIKLAAQAAHNGPPRSIIKGQGKKSHSRKVSFPKQLSQVIGFGGEWSDDDFSDVEYDTAPPIKDETTPSAIGEDEGHEELQSITKINTDFNMVNENLLADQTSNIKRSFAALKLGVTPKDAEGKKQTLKISVTPFGTSSTKTENDKTIYSSTAKKTEIISKPIVLNAKVKESTNGESSSNDETDNSIDLKLSEKSLLEEISETLEKNKGNKILKDESPETKVVKLEISNPILIKTSLDTKRTITRTIPIKRDQHKPKVNVSSKLSESDSNSSDVDTGISDYYDVVEATNSYENVPDGFVTAKAVLDMNGSANQTSISKKKHETTITINGNETKSGTTAVAPTTTNSGKVVKSNTLGSKSGKSASFFSSQFISDMFSADKNVTENIRKRSEMYNLSDSTYMTSKITSDGLIVTKNCSEEALDSTGSSFDSSSDEEMSSMNRSESDSGIGICISNDYRNTDTDNRISEFSDVEKSKTSPMNGSNNSSDYEDIQTPENGKVTKEEFAFDAHKSRELAGEPDGRSEPDGSAEAPALPSSPPPAIDPRPSFLHGVKTINSPDKPKVPTKPTVNIIKQFPKRPQSAAQQQVIMQLQQVMSKSTLDLSTPDKGKVPKDDINDASKSSTKKNRAPNPPPSSNDNLDSKEIDCNDMPTDEKEEECKELIAELAKIPKKNTEIKIEKLETLKVNRIQVLPRPADDNVSSLYTRNQSTAIKFTAPVIREKDKRERATVNPKFRSLNNVSSMNGKDKHEKEKPGTPEPAPRKSLSISQDSLNLDFDKKPKKNKFSIKKFLRMGVSKQMETSYKKEGIYGEIPMSVDMSPDTPSAKPRLVIIHPLDLNDSAVEVLTDRRNSIDEAPKTPASPVTGKPPAPPQRLDSNRFIELNKPARPPPPKSAELRRKQKTALSTAVPISVAQQANDSENESNSSKTVDSVYANLGEVRSAIAPRKPERTASMREREEKQEQQRRRPIGENFDSDTLTTSKNNKQSTLSLSRTASDASDDAKHIPLQNKKATTQTPAPVDKQNKAAIYSNIQLQKKDNENLQKIQSLNNSEIKSNNEQKHNYTTPTNVDGNSNSIKNNNVKQSPISSKATTKINANSITLTSSSSSATTTPTTITSRASITTNNNATITTSNPLSSSSQSLIKNESFNERKKKIIELENHNLSSKVELFERTITEQQQTAGKASEYTRSSPSPSLPATNKVYLNDGIKNSVQKMSNTIDSYLKNKISASETNIFDSTTLYGTQSRISHNNLVNNKNNMHIRNSDLELRTSGSSTYEPIVMKQQHQMHQRASYPDNGSIYGGSVCLGYKRNSDLLQQANEQKKYASSFVNIPRAISMSYCGSEMGESEIYSPYSFCGSEAGADVAQGDLNDGWSTNTSSSRSTKTVNRLRMRKGRSVVHKNLEDNYGAVVIANHEALAQVLEQLQQSPPVPASLRAIANCMNLRFDDFNIIEGAMGIVVGRRAFHSAIWNNCAQLTLAVSADCNQISGVTGDMHQMSGAASGALNPIAEFCDLVPNNYLPLMPSTQIRMVQATISVLPRMHVDTLQSLGAILKSKSQNGSLLKDTSSQQALNAAEATDIPESSLISIEPNGTLKTTSNNLSFCDDILCREVGFVMLQLVNGLKMLQAKGMEEMPQSLSNVILCKELDNKDAQARLCVLQGYTSDASRDEEELMGTLCQCAQIALTSLLPPTKISPIVAHILQQERSESLSRAKSVLEYVLWGPSDVSLIGPIREREQALQRWLDLERATVLHGLVRSRVELTVYDECHLMFLVRSNSKIMCEASSIIGNFSSSDSG